LGLDKDLNFIQLKDNHQLIIQSEVLEKYKIDISINLKQAA
jgi:hypothetical protein